MSSYIEHHGIKNMKWGVRRFQNPDGTLTEEGKERRRLLQARSSAVSGAQTVVAGAQKINSIATTKPQNRYDTRKVLTREELNQMSNKELQDLITRMNLEQQYSNLTRDKASKSKIDTGLKYAEAFLSVAGGVLSMATAAYKIAKP